MPLIRCLKLVCGKGINDATYEVTKNKRVNGKTKTYWRCKFYDTWRSMITRCYHPKAITTTYNGCSVCEEWLTFSNFKSWMETQDWKGKALDKDLLVLGNTIYSPETCCFVSQHVNSFLTKSNSTRGEFPLGVYFKFKIKRYIGQIHVRGQEKQQHLGCFLTPMSAHRAWQKEKINQAKILQSEQTDAKVIKGLQRVIDKIQNDYDNNLETKDF